MSKLRVGILGATGAVGQKFIEILADHPWFEITALAASERSAGKVYQDTTNWIGSTPIPASIATMIVQESIPPLACDFVFSGLDASVAGIIEATFANSGYPVISNAKNYRMESTVPLLIPEVNASHIGLIDSQNWNSSGFIVTNPNCSTVGLVTALKPLYDDFGIEKVHVTTMQALSGAGYPGVSSLDILGNVIPYIGGEEDKVEIEPLKILGTYQQDAIDFAKFQISAQCNRVSVLDGHLECVSIQLKKKATVEDLKASFRTFESEITSLSLPTAPDPLYHVFEDERFPQPRRHSSLGNGMAVSIGRIRPCPILDFKFVVLSHNTLRGAAGGAVLNAEILYKKGYLKSKSTK